VQTGARIAAPCASRSQRLQRPGSLLTLGWRRKRPVARGRGERSPGEDVAGGRGMIMRITWGKLRPGSWNEFEKTYNATVVAKGSQIKGLRGRWLLQDTSDKDTGFAVSLWDGATEMQAYEQSDVYRHEFAPALQPFFVGDYKTYRCEVKYRQ
jgi:heme-degrading monooxygenase HmoA